MRLLLIARELHLQRLSQVLEALDEHVVLQETRLRDPLDFHDALVWVDFDVL